jgi:cell shape-determining protein MreC
VPGESDSNNLKMENYQLRSQLDLVYNWLNSEKYLSEQIEMFRTLGMSSELVKRRSEEMKSLLQKKTMAALGRIIYRDPSAWSSTCWIDAGEENNALLGKTIIAKNSPVISGSALVGVVEYVGKRQSRVRLITDSSLKTAVRAVRGSVAERDISLLTQMLQDRLRRHPFKQTLQEFKQTLKVGWEDGYFAKGEISGTSAPYFRSLQPILKGIGFNCNFEDMDSPARDLKAGILRENDLLITSGLDGIFPPGLQVGRVINIKPLRPGGFSYDLEATPSAGDLADLTFVYVLPPVSD